MIAPAFRSLAALALALAAGVATGQGVTARTVVLGQSAPLSGPLQRTGEDLRNGALAYLRKLNDAGGVNGRRVELATLDDGGDPKRALENTRRFIEVYRVFVLFGYPEASATREVLALAHRARMPMLGPDTGAAFARQSDRAVFTVAAGRADEIDRVIDHYAALGRRRFALLREDDAAGKEYAGEARASLARHGLDPPADVPMGRDGTDHADAVRLVSAANPDIVLIALAQPPAADMVKRLKSAGTRAQLVALSGADAALTAQALGPSGAGLALSQTVPPLARISLPVVGEYRAALADLSAVVQPTPRSLEAFIAAKVAVEAIRRAGTSPTRDSLLAALEAMSSHDTGGFRVGYSRTQRQGSARVYLQAIDSDGTLLH